MKFLPKGMSLPLIIRQIPLFVLAMWSVIPGSAPDSPDQLLRVGLTYKFRSYSRRLRRSPGHIAGAFFLQIDPAWLNSRDLCSSQIARF